MTTGALFWALKQKVARPAEALVLIHLADRAGHLNTAYPSLAYITECTGLNRRTVMSALDGLESKGLIFDSGERKGATLQVKVYGLNLTVDKTAPSDETVQDLLGETVHVLSETVHKTTPNSAGKCTRILLDTIKDTNNYISTTTYFDEFWKLYPNKTAKPKCLSKWKSEKLDLIAEKILNDVRAKLKSDDWIKDNGKYIPMSLTYINQQRWDDEKVSVSSSTVRNEYVNR